MTKVKKFGLVFLINLGLLFALAFGSMATASAVDFSGGSGTENDPYIITSAAELYKIRDNDKLACYYRLDADIDLSGYSDGDGWIPIGNDSTKPFSGSLDGDGHKITNLYIDLPEASYTGLFGYSTGKIKNIHLENAIISGYDSVGALVGRNESGTIEKCSSAGTVSGVFNVGGLVGFNNAGVIENCSSTGTVSGTFYAGGLAGSNHRNESTNEKAYIRYCSSTSTMTGDGGYLGGLVGFNFGGSIQECCSTGTVSGIFNLGGLVGVNNTGTVENCYSTGSVTGDDYVGGLTAANQSAAIRNCYSTGTVSGNSTAGGLVVFNEEGTIENCYYNSDIIGDEDENGFGTAKTTAEMVQLATYTGWDFANIWGIVGEAYPFLRALSPVTSTPELINDTINYINSLGIQGMSKSLVSQLNVVSSLYEEGEITPAINKLNAFINHVEAQKGKKITEDQAGYLLEKAQLIIKTIESE